MHRLFLAIWPSKTACQRITDAVNADNWPRDSRLVAPERWHVTLHFIGNVPTSRLTEIGRKLEVRFDPFFITLNRAVSWGHLTVLEPNSVTTPLASLHQKLAGALNKLDLPVESRPFRPHVTLARKNRGEAQPRAHGTTESRVITTVRWKVKNYSLVESMLGSNSNYRIIKNYEIK